VLVAAASQVGAGEDVVDLGPCLQLLAGDAPETGTVPVGRGVVRGEGFPDGARRERTVGHGEGDDEFGQVVAERGEGEVVEVHADRGPRHG
jgi:hypothetical protein